MKVYVFGNILFLVVVIYGFWKVLFVGDDDVCKFVYNNFYVDDGLMLFVIELEVINLMRKI